jgi:hypothetical protein
MRKLNKILAEKRDRMYATRREFPDFAARALYIRPKSGPVQPLVLNDVQELLHKMAERQRAKTGRVRMLVLKARQPGVSTYVEGRFFWKTIRSQGLRAFILTHEEAATDNLFAIAKRFHANCPSDEKVPRLTANNSRELKFGEIDCSYRVGTAGTEGLGRSETIQLFHGSEVAHWPHAETHAAGVLQAVPDADGTEIWLESTANGPAGLFYTLCMRAEAGIGDYELAFVPWFVHAEYKKIAPGDWVPESDWREYGETYKLTQAQLYWAWKKNADLAGAIGDTLDKPCWLFRQEYPATAQDAFRTSGGRSYLSPEVVETAIEASYPDETGAALVLGVDVARGGADKTHIIDRRGRRLGHTINEMLDDSDEMAIAGRLVQLIRDHRPDMVFVDITGGYGGGVVDRLREQGFLEVRGVNFGWQALDNKTYANKRAEMWAGLRGWLMEGADIVDDPVLRRHLTAPMDRLDSSGKLILEKKDDIRKRLGLSPDRADAAALTFAEPVRRKSARHGPESTHSVYDTLGY